MVISDTVARQLEDLADKGKYSKFHEMVKDIHPYDLSEFLQKLDTELRDKILANLQDEILINLIPELPEEMQLEFVEVLSPRQAAKLLTNVPPDEMADMLGDLSIDTRRKIVSYFSKEKTDEAKVLLKYSDDTAGGLMTPEVVALPMRMTAKNAMKHVREKAEEYETIYYLYVTDKEGRLVGVLSLRDLVLASPRALLKDIMNPEVIKVPVDMDQEEVGYIISDYDLLAVPVVDKNNKLLGIITVDDIIDVIEEEVTEDLAHLSGTTPEIDRLITASVTEVVKARLPWLIFALIGDGLVASFVLKTFEKTLASVVALALFIPVIMTMGGNVGIQSSTVFVRGIATGEIQNTLKYFVREIKIGFIMGVLVGLGVSSFAQLLIGKPNIGLVVGAAMFCTMTLASVTGVLIPKVFDRIGVDPAISSSPFVTTLQDITGLTIYFSMASLMLGYMV